MRIFRNDVDIQAFSDPVKKDIAGVPQGTHNINGAVPAAGAGDRARWQLRAFGAAGEDGAAAAARAAA